MTGEPTLDDVLAVMTAASAGKSAARVTVPEAPSLDHQPTQLALALNVLLDDRSNRTKRAERLTQRLRTLADASHEFAAATQDQKQLIDKIVRRLGAVATDYCVVLLVSEDNRELTLAALQAPDSDALRRAEKVLSHPLSLDRHPIAARVHESGEHFFEAMLDDERIRSQTTPEHFAFLKSIGVYSLIILPLRVDDRPFGQVVLARSRPSSGPFDEDDLNLARGLVEHAALAVANARSHDARKAAEAKFSRLSHSGIIGIIVSDLDSNVREINDALLDLLGYTREEILSGAVKWKDLTPPEWRSLDQHALGELTSIGVASLREKEYIGKDGARVPVLVGTAMLEGPGRESISFVLGLRGSKRLRAAIERLREARASEETFRSFINAAPDAVVIVDKSGKIVLVNSQTERLFGYSRDELLGQSVDILVPELVRARHPAHRETFFAAPRVRAMGSGLELYALRKDGTEVPVEISLSPLETEQGTLVSSSIRDITERKRADEQRFRLAALVESSDDAIIGKSLEGIITSWNEGAHRIFGFSADEMIGQPILRLIPPERFGEEQDMSQRVASGNSGQFETVRLRKDGSRIDVSITISPVRDSRGRLVGAAKVARDITERRRAERALARAKDAAETANRELEAFSYSVAHDLRAPLRAMNGFAHLLLESHRDKLDGDGQDWLRHITVNAQKMASLIDALLSLARLTRSAPRREPVDLSSVVHAIAKEFSAAESTRSVELVVEDNLTADVDPVLARALLENLLGNAWKFTSKVRTPRIEFGVTRRDGAAAFFVRDNGAGFDMAFSNKLFAPFQRLHAAAEFPGSGIGLATVQRIVHRHGGQIWAEAAVGAGATFYFDFSRAESP